MAEELRLLYVAMTRAKEKLILSMPAAAGSGGAGEAGGGPVCSTAPPWRWSASRAWAAGCCFTPWPGPRRSALRSMAGLPEVSRGDSGARLGYSLGRWGGTGPDSGAEGPLRGSARRVGDGTGGAESGAGLALSVLPFLPDPLQAHRHPAQGPGAWTRRPAEEAAPAALPPQPLSILRPQFVAGGAGTHPGPAGHSPAPGHAVSAPGHGHPGAGSGGAGAPGVAAASSPPSRGRRPIRDSCPRSLTRPWAGRWRRPPCAAGSSNSPCCCRRRSSAPAWSRGGGAAPGRSGLPGSRTLEGITVVDFKSDRVSRSGAAARARGVPPSAGGVQPGPGGDHRKTGGPKGALVLRTGGADPSVKGRQKDREKSQDNFLKK